MGDQPIPDRESGSSEPEGIDAWTERKLDKLAQWIRDAQCIVWFTGAGISTESGLRDYRGPNGVWTRRRRGLPRPVAKRPFDRIEPNRGHRAIVGFEQIGKCAFLISQNVDNLHIKSGFPVDKLAELHGNKTRFRCRRCGKTYPMANFSSEPGLRQKARRGEVSFPCPDCGRRLEYSVINFGDRMPEQDVEAAYQWARKADLMIIVGSSCHVFPAADIPRATKENNGRVVIINRGETGLDDIYDLRFGDEKAGKLLARLLEKVRPV